MKKRRKTGKKSRRVRFMVIPPEATGCGWDAKGMCGLKGDHLVSAVLSCQATHDGIIAYKRDGTLAVAEGLTRGDGSVRSWPSHTLTKTRLREKYRLVQL